VRALVERYRDCRVHVAYEACGFGYEMAWWLQEQPGVSVTVIAPSRVERAPGLMVKTDRLDAGKLARKLRVTRGGFYWFFSSRGQLLDELLAFWQRTSTTLFEGILRSKGHNGMQEFLALVDLWVEEQDYDPTWDAAIRDWARTSPKVARIVHDVDERRIATLHRIFIDLDYRDPEALVRARITYYHQVGYYALGVREPHRRRRRLSPYYTRVLTGRAP
jgi:AcrR family transcriptional regulator